MSDEHRSDVMLAAIKSNPKALFGYVTAITLSCSGLLMATLYDASILATIGRWL